MTEKLVVIGNGMAAGRVLDHVFERDAERYSITMFGAEPRVNYNRILLSPVLSGEKEFADIVTHDEAWYAEHKIDLRGGVSVVSIDRAAKTVTDSTGAVTAYDKLLIATGSSPFIIPVPGHDLPGIVTYRDLDDVNAMLAAAEKGGHAVVIGGGLLGRGQVGDVGAFGLFGGRFVGVFRHVSTRLRPRPGSIHRSASSASPAGG